MLRSVLAAALLSLGTLGAHACEGQTGSVIFEDTFSDDSGGWQLTAPEAVIKPPDMLLTLNAKSISIASQNLTFNATDGDYCAEFNLPKSIAADNSVGFALQFWATDYANLFQFEIYSNGSLALYKKVQGNWSTVYKEANVPSLKTDPDAVNSLRVIAKDSKLTLFVSGTQMHVIRAQTPQGSLRFGVYADLDKAVDGAPAVRVKSFKVTSGQQ